ncbi:MAG: STAS domain-containing protein [Flavobacteriales bacterium]|nr:STAS domain-containing protein [Flavobacteriales bacterium]
MQNTKIALAVALRASLKNYNLKTFKNDLIAGFIVSLVALPLSMALAIAVGLPPQHGIYTAIVAGIIVPLLGGSLQQVTGPTAAFVVILAPIVTELGLRGMVWCTIMAGAFIILMGIAQLGRLINYIPYPVTTGFTAGIAVVLLTHALSDFLGLGIKQLEGTFVEKVLQIGMHLKEIKLQELTIGVVTLLCFFIPGNILRWMPKAVIAMTLGGSLGYIFQTYGFEVQTIGNHFSYTTENGDILNGIPAIPPQIGWPTFEAKQVLTIPSFTEFRGFLFPAFTIAILAALESLLSATVADSYGNTKHHPNSELKGLGIGNIMCGLALGLPATGAIARTATNIQTGGKTPFSAVFHAILIMLYVMFFANLINFLPMACLAALLINTAFRMSHYNQFYNILKIAPGSDAIVLLTCFFLTVFVDMVAGVGIGMIFASFLLMKRLTEMTHIELEHHTEDNSNSEALGHMPKGTIYYKIRGPLFFGVVEKAFDRQNIRPDNIKQLVLDITDIPFIDMTGLVAIKSFLAVVATQDHKVYVICNVKSVTDKIKLKISGTKSQEFVEFYHHVNDVLSVLNREKLLNIENLYVSRTTPMP